MLNAGVSFSVLMFTTVICLIVLTIFICKLLVSATKLTDNVNVISNSVKQEIEPTLKELKEAAKSLNSIANSADTKFHSAKENISSIIGATACVGDKLRGFTKGILKGVAFGLGMFKK